MKRITPLICLVLFLLAGYYFFVWRPEHGPRGINVEVRGAEHVQWRLICDNKDVPIKKSFSGVEVLVPRALLDGLRLQVHAMDGWVTLTNRVMVDTLLSPTPFLAGYVRPVRLLIDNNTLQQQVITIGETNIQVSSNTKLQQDLPGPVSRKVEVLLNGKHCGDISPDHVTPKYRFGDNYYLVDCSGSNRYELVELTYSTLNLKLTPSPASTYYTNAYLHELVSDVDYFLVAPPNQVLVKFPSQGETKHLLSRCIP